MSRAIYGICVDDIDINQRKLLKLMKETPPDFPSDSKSVYDDYIAVCNTESMLISPEEWIKNYVFVINECEMHGIGALLYKNMRLNNPEKMIFCTTGADGRVYLGLPISESWKICKDMTYTTNKEIQDTLKKYIRKISDNSDKAKISTIKYD